MIEVSAVERTRLVELEAVVKGGLQTFYDVGHALMEIRDARLYRDSHGSFEDYCRERWSMQRAHAYRLIGSAEVMSILSPTGDTPANERQARELAPLLRDDETAVVDVWRELKAKYGDDVTAERVKRLVAGRLERVRREREASLPVPVPAALPATCELAVSAIEELRLAPGSVDAIITDPPYPREYLPVYEQLGRFAAEALRPGSSLLVMVNQKIHYDAHRLIAPHLDYEWMISYALPGYVGREWRKQLYVTWKPVLWFTNGPKVSGGEWITDSVTSDASDKQHHHWGQSVSGMRQLVERFSRPGDLVVDPFVGGGATAVAALEAQRRFVGSDIDPAAIATTSARVAQLGQAAA
ncbi:MAG: DNA methyltransferase [Gaiellaceae bacterium]